MINEHKQITLFPQTISLFVSKLACVSFNPTRKVDLSFFAQLTTNRLGSATLEKYKPEVIVCLWLIFFQCCAEGWSVHTLEIAMPNSRYINGFVIFVR